MKPSRSIRPISYLKAHAAKIVREITLTRDAVIITQRGEAKAVLQDVHAFEDLQESLAFLKLLAQSRRSIERGRLTRASEAFRRVRARAKRTRRR